jgi:integrase
MELRWADVDVKDRVVRFRDTKNGSDHIMPTGEYLTGLLNERLALRQEGQEYVFSGRGSRHLADPRKTMERIEALSGSRFMLSDLRRTFASHGKALGIDYFDVQRLLNHRVKANEATPGYILMAIERKRELVQRIEDFFLKAGGLKDTPVISLSLATMEKAA